MVKRKINCYSISAQLHFGGTSYGKLYKTVNIVNTIIIFQSVLQLDFRLFAATIPPHVVPKVSLGMLRASVGVQSLQDAQLQSCGRGHDAQQAVEALRLLRPRLSRLSADLLCGLPGQQAKELVEDLGKLNELEAPEKTARNAWKRLENGSKWLENASKMA